MAVVFTIIEMNYLMVVLLNDLAHHIRIYASDLKFFVCAICIDCVIVTKGAMSPPKVMPSNSVPQFSYFQAKMFPLV